MIRSSNLRNLILPTLLIASMLLASCGKATPVPAPSAPTSQAEAVAATDTPATQPVKPTVAPTVPPTPTVVPLDLPPVAVETMPQRGAEQPLDAPIVVRFDQPMDETSTVAAFAIEPAVDGDLSLDGAALTFQPNADALARGESYRVTVSQDAQSSGGKTLAAPVDLHFSTVGFLQVTSTQPGDGNEEVAVDAPITVVFNRPVVPLTSVAGQAGLPQPLKISPATDGTGEWLNTSIYMFHPAQPLAGGADYRVTVPAGLTDVKGSLLAEDYEFSFTTALPVVESILPEGPMVKPTTVVTVTFSQPMDQQSAKDATVLRRASDKRAVAGRTRWLDGDRVLIFEPLTDLDFATDYLVEVADSAKTATGSGTLRSPFSGQFATAPKLALLSTDPANGDKNVPVEQQAVIAFQGIVDEKTLGEDAFTIIPKPTDVYSYFNTYENRWQISWPRQPQTDYTLTLAGDISDIFGNQLGEQTIRFQTGDRKPFAHLNVPNDIGTYDAYAPSEIAASYRNVSSLDFKLYEVNETQTERLLGPNRYDALNNFNPAADALVREWSVPVTPEANSNNLLKVPLAENDGALPAGVYWLEMRAPEVKYGDGSPDGGQQPARHLLIVSPLNLIAKRTATEVLVWATDLQSGQPVAGLPVRASGDVDATGVTDADGIVRLAATNKEPWQPLTVFAGNANESATGGAPLQYGVMSTEWQTGLGPWDYNLPGEFPPPSSQGYVYTDRPIYRPGQTVYWKAILRSDDDAIYTPPPVGTKYTATIRNFQGEEVYKGVHETNAFGTINGALPLDEEAGLGFYYLEIMPADASTDVYFIPSYGTNFQVAEYRKPEFEATLTTAKSEVLGGDTITATMAAEFFFGGAVSDAEVRWTTFTQDTSFNYQSEDGTWYSFNDYTGWDPVALNMYGGLVASGEGKTGADGSYTFEVPADISDKVNSQQFTIDARLTDLNNQEVAQNTSVTVHKGLVYPGVAPRSYVAAVGDPLATDLITVDWDGTPVPNVDLAIEVSLAEWKNVQKKASDGQFYWASEVKETPVLSDSATTGADGKAIFTWTPEAGGQYKIKAIATDELGNEVRSSAFVWAGESGSDTIPWAIDNNDRIELVADKPLYQVGDTAKVLVPHPFSGPVEALLTIERGEIIETQVITIDGNSETLEIPITEEHVPNIFVSVALVKGEDPGSDALGSFKLGYAMLPVDPVVKELNVTLTASQSQLKPGD
ncbi:MAG: Ig-like domain-containing protein, partial [Anaerolineae bacterium]|nr:Ig-like domain-containing protein [Anaerolineae bacterium]